MRLVLGDNRNVYYVSCYASVFESIEQTLVTENVIMERQEGGRYPAMRRYDLTLTVIVIK